MKKDYKFQQANGRIYNANELIFPICYVDKYTRNLVFLGTGTFINSEGGFVTAKHVMFVKNKFNPLKRDKPAWPLFIIQSIGNERHIRQVERIDVNPNSDVGVGLLVEKLDNDGNRITNPKLAINTGIPKKKDVVKTFAYPNSEFVRTSKNDFEGDFIPDWFQGEVTEIITEQRGFYQGEIIQSNMPVDGGASGGPVLNLKGEIIAVNSGGDPNSNPPISSLTPIRNILSIQVTEKMTIKDLGNAGVITIKEEE